MSADRIRVRTFSVGQTVFGVRDLEQSDKGIVLGHEANERVLVKFGDELPRILPVRSLQPADKSQIPPDIERILYSQATNFGHYLRLMGEAPDGLFNTKEQHEKSIRSHQPAHDR